MSAAATDDLARKRMRAASPPACCSSAGYLVLSQVKKIRLHYGRMTVINIILWGLALVYLLSFGKEIHSYLLLEMPLKKDKPSFTEKPRKSLYIKPFLDSRLFIPSARLAVFCLIIPQMVRMRQMKSLKDRQIVERYPKIGANLTISEFRITKGFVNLYVSKFSHINAINIHKCIIRMENPAIVANSLKSGIIRVSQTRKSAATTL